MKKFTIIAAVLWLTACASFRSNTEREDECRNGARYLAEQYGMSTCVLMLIESDRQHDKGITDLLTNNGKGYAPAPPIASGFGSEGGTPVYNSSQCIGTTVMGSCQGSTIGAPVAVCHGTMLNGICTGPMF